MKLGESHNQEAARWGRPLDGVRILALEQMQALPFATQLLARLGADVVKVELPGRGDSARASKPAIVRENGEAAGATFVRNNLNKRSIAVDYTTDRGRQLVADLADQVDVVGENLGPGRAEKFGLGYDDLYNQRLIYVSITGFGTLDASPYATWPAYAGVAEAMSGMYEYSRRPHEDPVVNPLGGTGDSGTGLYAVIALLAALRHRDVTGEGQFVDIAIYDSMLSLLDLAYNYWSMGVRRQPDEPQRIPVIAGSFRTGDGFVMLQIARPHQLERLAGLLGHPEWTGQDEFADGRWPDAYEPIVRPALEEWSKNLSNLDAARTLAEAGIPAGPCYSGSQVPDDEHVKLRRMVVEIPNGVDEPALVGGNPIKMTKMVEGPDRPLPLLGEHTDEVLGELLGLDGDAVDDLRLAGVIDGGKGG
jgi:crotonobetainyl-CoA:carnitine CoA-transferase CaiB-like acyl-CoA transferase